MENYSDFCAYVNEVKKGFLENSDDQIVKSTYLVLSEFKKRNIPVDQKVIQILENYKNTQNLTLFDKNTILNYYLLAGEEFKGCLQ